MFKTDYYNCDELFSPEERLVRDTVRDFVGNAVNPVIEQHFMDGTFPRGLVPMMAGLGLFGVTIPEEYGGAGANYTTYGLAMQELERGDSAVRSFASVQNSLVMYPIFRYACESMKKLWLPRLAAGTAIGCFGLTEPDFGSNPGGMITRAERTAGGTYLLNGTKMWITNGSIADVAIVWAKLDDKVRGFIVETNSKGFSAPEIRSKHSLRASVTSELILEDVEVPEEQMLDVKGLRGPLSCLDKARFGIAWGALGAAMSVYESSLDYAGTRIQFGRPISSFQLVQEKLVGMLSEITKAQLLVWRLGRMADDGSATPAQISLAKRNNVAMALEAARVARDIHGANGISSEYPVMRHAANLESVKTYEGTHDIHTLIIGADITGHPAFM